MNFVYVKSGCFIMGCEGNNPNCYMDEKPPVKKCVKGFWISETEVPLKLWWQFVKSTHYRPAKKDLWGCEDTAKPMFKQTPEDPVVCISWLDAQAFINWLREKTKLPIDLPTEIQWEYACKKGKSETVPANYWSGFGGRSQNDPFRYTSPVKALPPNKLGLYGMMGNVWEMMKEKGLIKGCGWESKRKLLRCSVKMRVSPERSYDTIGFRLVINQPSP